MANSNLQVFQEVQGISQRSYCFAPRVSTQAVAGPAPNTAAPLGSIPLENPVLCCTVCHHDRVATLESCSQGCPQATSKGGYPATEDAPWKDECSSSFLDKPCKLMVGEVRACEQFAFLNPAHWVSVPPLCADPASRTSRGACCKVWGMGLVLGGVCDTPQRGTVPSTCNQSLAAGL